MKRNLLVMMIAAAAWTLPAAAQSATRAVQQSDLQAVVTPADGVQHPVPGVGVSDVSVMRNEGYMAVGMDVDLRGLKVRRNRAVLLTPCLVNGDDSLALYSVGIYSRRRYFYYLRNCDGMLTGPTEVSCRERRMPDTMIYHSVVPYADWMNGSALVLRRRDYGCRSALTDEYSGALGGYRNVTYTPEFHYVRPVAETVKLRELSGRAYIDFPVNRTEIFPDYRNNPTELAKIIATIDSVRNDRDVTVRRITIKGYASPESPWENNTRLAKGRTATLKQYVRNLYRFDEDFIATDYEPEDWAGLRAFVAQSALEHRDEILAIIDDPTLPPDPKEWRIKLRYPEDYKFLLATVYPGLRHSDYTIEYTIRQFSDVDEIREAMATAPQKLSLNEMYVLAQSLEAGSEAYNDVFETAVRMYPDDATANLNAANAAMGRKDYASAARYLEKAGTSAEAVYARGVLAALQGDYAAAESFVREARALGLADTEGVLDHLDEVRRYGDGAAAGAAAGAGGAASAAQK